MKFVYLSYCSVNSFAKIGKDCLVCVALFLIKQIEFSNGGVHSFRQVDFRIFYGFRANSFFCLHLAVHSIVGVFQLFDSRFQVFDERILSNVVISH